MAEYDSVIREFVKDGGRERQEQKRKSKKSEFEVVNHAAMIIGMAEKGVKPEALLEAHLVTANARKLRDAILKEPRRALCEKVAKYRKAAKELKDNVALLIMAIAGYLAGKLGIAVAIVAALVAALLKLALEMGIGIFCETTKPASD